MKLNFKFNSFLKKNFEHKKNMRFFVKLKIEEIIPNLNVRIENSDLFLINNRAQ